MSCGFHRLPCCIMRGGTSKGIFLKKNHLPVDPARRDAVILEVFGSPDVRQIDGLGGADPLTSKLAIIGPSTRPDADVDYTFAQVSIDRAFVDFNGNCGNISSAVGPFAINEGLVRVTEPVTRVRIHNTNTGKLLIADVPVEGGVAAVRGQCRIDGVPGTGAEILLDFSDTLGSATGKLLPTGQPLDRMKTSRGTIDVSIVDVANPVVFVRARDVSMKGTETPKEINGNAELLAYLEEIRGRAAVLCGMAKDVKDALETSPAFPMLAFVCPPHDYTDFTTGKTIHASQVDMVSRLMYMQVLHKTYAGTGTCCTGAAMKIPGTIAHEATPGADGKVVLRIGHPAGVIQVHADFQEGKLARCAFARTARRIMDGYVYLKG
ncbi:PrpF domain-containing protein [Desulfovibrio aminophilus]|uniref:2-methylaconitate cis-trans isomerase PrpF family protein n=1 Tax=Desulfovibrio aminophilus TaxID=81425 RepID=UPI00339AB0DD